VALKKKEKKEKKRTKPFLVVGHLVLIRVECVHTLKSLWLLFKQLNSILGRKDK
jgi:hypothetical protein